MSYKISNYTTYNKGMASSIQDKCWWIDYIPLYVDTIIDYGCATGELFAYIQSHYPNRFKNFIGIDNNDTMLEFARSRNIIGAKFYKHFEPIKVNGKNTIGQINLRCFRNIC